MYSRLVMMGLEGSFYIIAALPFLVCWAVRFFRKEGKGAWKLAAGFLVFVLYLCCVAAVTGLPSLQYLTFDPNLQMIPFYHLWPERVHNVLNIIMFVPAGLLLPLVWEKYGKLKETAGYGFLLSLLIECSQLLCWRVTDINDLIMNTFGAVVGWMVWRLLLRGRTLGAHTASPWHAAAIVWAAAFFLEVFVSDFFWNRLYEPWFT